MATKYLVSGGNGLWSNSNNWSLTSGGPSGTGAPNAGDDVIFDANSMNAPMTVNTTSNCNSMFMSNYTGVFTYSAALNVLQAFEYSVGMTTAGASTLNLGNNTSTPASACSVNFNGITHNAALSFNNTNGTGCTYTITGDLNVMGLVNFANSNLGGSGVKATVNGGNILCNAGFGIYGNGNRWITGTSIIRFVGSGSGNFTSGVSAFFLNMSIEFAKTGGTIDMTSGAIYTRGTTITYTSGNFTNFLLACNVGSATLTTPGLTWSNVSCGGGSLSNNGLLSTLNLSISSAFTIGGTGDINTNTMFNSTSFGLGNGKTLNISTTWSSVATAAAQFTVSSPAGAKINLSTSAAQDIAHTNAVNIDSSGGKTIYSYRVVTLTNTINWATLPIITTINTNSIFIN